jgi:ABC-type sugar transport system substrate-binding protein
MFRQKRIWAFITLIVVAMMVLAACADTEVEPTEAPAAPTEAPAEEPTEAPAEEPTEVPAEEPTEAPAEEPTEAPAEEPTEEPVEEAMEEPDVVTTEGSLGEAREMIFITHDMHPFFVPTIVGMSDACLAVGWECSFVGPPSFSVEGTLERIESAIASGPDAIAMVFSDPEAYNELAQDAVDQGISVVGYNTDNDFRADAGLGYVGQDQFNAGFQNGLQAAKWAGEVTGRDDGKIVVMTCCPGHTALEERIRGTVAAIEETSGYTTEVLNGTDDAEQYVANVEAKYQAESDEIVGFAGVSGYTENLGRFAEANSLGGVVALGGFDLLPTTMESIAAGDMQWTIGQDPYTQGFIPVMMAWNELERGYPARFYDTGAEIIDPSNIEAVIAREQSWIDLTPQLGLDPGAAETTDTFSAEGQLGAPRTMTYITHDMHPFFVPTIVGMADACGFFNWECSFVGPPSFSVEGTLSRIESSIAAGPDAIGMVFSDPEAYNELAEDAVGQGMVVVGYNTDNDFRADLGLGYVGQDQFNAGFQNGVQAVKWAQEITGRDEGKIVVMTCCPGHTALEERIRGTVAAIEETSNYTTEVLNGTDDAAQYVANVEAKYQAESDDIVGFAGVSGYTENLGRFAEANSLGGVIALGGFDLLPTTMESIANGDMQWAIGQDPYTQGLMPVLMAWKQLERGYPGVFYDTGAEIVDPSNVADIIVREQSWVDRTPELGLQG